MKIVTTFLMATFLICSNVQADTIVFENFEDATITYTTSVVDDLSDIASRDYFGRIAPDTILPPVDISYSNAQGSGYYGAQDTDGANSGNIDIVTLDWTGINISNFENLSLSWFVAEDNATDGNEDWDLSSSVRLSIQLNGAGFQDIFAIESEIGTDGNDTNEKPRVDTDFNTVGDGTEITDTFTQFTSAIFNGTSLDIRLTIEDLDSGDEDIAFDNLLLTGDATAVPEPSSLGILFGLGALAIGRRRN